MSKIELSEMIVELRRELLKAQQQGENEDLKFRIEDIDIELQIATTKEAGAEGGVQFWVYNAKAQGKLASQAVHTLRLKLKPLTPQGDLEVTDRGQKPED
jgi:hypothetical protein